MNWLVILILAAALILAVVGWVVAIGRDHNQRWEWRRDHLRWDRDRWDR